jgi:hypothetical protein
VPPELLLLTQLMEAPDEGTIRQILEANAPMVDASFVALLEQVEQDMRARGEEKLAQKAALALGIARTMAPQGPPEEQKPTQRPSGLIMARG